MKRHLFFLIHKVKSNTSSNCLKMILVLAVLFTRCIDNPGLRKSNVPDLQYKISLSEQGNQTYNVEFIINDLDLDTIVLKMPEWMPGYYQIMSYSDNLSKLEARDEEGNSVAISEVNDHTWSIVKEQEKSIIVEYDIYANRQFVASSYVDSSRAYLAPAGTFLYIEGYLNLPVRVIIETSGAGDKIATGLEALSKDGNVFQAPDFDILYDCPILIGELEELEPFFIDGIEHRFIGYQMGEFDREKFMASLKSTVAAAIDIIGDIPYKNYTFIGMGPGRGGIEHLNNTTIPFNGSRLGSPEAKISNLAFIAHEYFHHYNVKRIRPFELGPFDYDRENRTNQLWISEGLTSYYEYIILRRAGLIDEATLLSFYERIINTLQNDSGRHFQSLQQASYNTWRDGPFGSRGAGSEDRSISYYDKGAVLGILLDFEIRQASQNTKSLDDVMQHLYWSFYKEKDRGFTEAEFQNTCEKMAGKSLNHIFEYVYTTKELDYNKYLESAGLKIEKDLSKSGQENNKVVFRLVRIEELNEMQSSILSNWQGESEF